MSSRRLSFAPRHLTAAFALAGALLTLGASISSCGTTIILTECGEGREDCDGSCVDLSSDADHCGDCDTQCASGACADSQCVEDPCAAPFELCEGSCVDPRSDHDHCGGCGVDCKDLFCEAGTCVSTCSPQLSVCDGACVDTASDPNNCGGCGVTCPAACVGGQCTSECPPGLSLCNGQCVDTTSDPNHCGGCNNPCGGTGSCVNGFCQQFCEEPFTFCSGECVDLASDESNCGSCGFLCDLGASCQGFQCVGQPTCDDDICGICDIVSLPSTELVSFSGNTSSAGNTFLPSCTGFEAPEVLHRFTAPSEGTYSIDAFGSSYDTTLEILADFCGSIVCEDDTFGLDPQVQIALGAGESIFIVLDGFDEGPYQLHIQKLEECPPDLTSCGGECVDLSSDPFHCGFCFNQCGEGAQCNDFNCEDIAVCEGFACGACGPTLFLDSSVPQIVQGSTSGVLNGLGASCGSATGGEIGHYFQAPFAGTFVFSTAMSGFDTIIDVRDLNSCAELACSDNFGMSASGRVSVPLAQGQEVFAIVDGAFGQSGFYNLSISATPVSSCPTSTLTMVPSTVSGSTVGSSNSFAPTCVSSNAPEHTYIFTAPTTGTFVFDTFGSSYDTTLYVLSAQCGGQQLVCNDDVPGMGTNSRVNLSMTAGQTVTVVVDGFQSSAGSYVLHVNQI